MSILHENMKMQRSVLDAYKTLVNRKGMVYVSLLGSSSSMSCVHNDRPIAGDDALFPLILSTPPGDFDQDFLRLHTSALNSSSIDSASERLIHRDIKPDNILLN